MIRLKFVKSIQHYFTEQCPVRHWYSGLRPNVLCKDAMKNGENNSTLFRRKISVAKLYRSRQGLETETSSTTAAQITEDGYRILITKY